MLLGELEINKAYHVDCLEGLKQLPDNSIDSIVTDPPYELGFMNKKWDSTGIAYNVDMWKECLRVLKPGGHLLSFGGARTYHRMACAIEDAGFEIRDQIMWIYGSGFPKSRNIGSGWGTSLKPAHEPIVLARKPLSEKNVVDNVLKWGTGGINIDDCRIPTNWREEYPESWFNSGKGKTITWNGENYKTKMTVADRISNNGRFPANIIFDEEAGNILNNQSGHLKSGTNCVRTKPGTFLEHGGLGKAGDVQITYGDSSGSSRFFYCAKASKKERGEENNHPTVKPIKLMEYLIKLITPPSGIVLDPFAGSGTTLIAAKSLDFNYIGFEKEKDYIDIINKRMQNT